MTYNMEDVPGKYVSEKLKLEQECLELVEKQIGTGNVYIISPITSEWPSIQDLITPDDIHSMAGLGSMPPHVDCKHDYKII